MTMGWTGEDVKGFTKILSNPMKIYYSVNKKSDISDKNSVK